jgi:hypothetical protein
LLSGDQPEAGIARILASFSLEEIVVGKPAKGEKSTTWKPLLTGVVTAR